MARDKAQTRIDPDTGEALDDYCEDIGISQSEVIRRAIRRYLTDEGYPVAAADGAGEYRRELDRVGDELANVESRLDETADQIRARREARDHLKRQQTIVGAVALAYVAVTLLLPDLGWLTGAWAVAGIGLAAVIAYQTYWIGVAADE
jgi:antitoxin component of RelBE/YafQ-DinJ toxin-antitoxin module